MDENRFYKEMKKKMSLKTMIEILKIYEEDARMAQVYAQLKAKDLVSLTADLTATDGRIISAKSTLDQIISTAFEAKRQEIALNEAVGSVRHWKNIINYAKGTQND